MPLYRRELEDFEARVTELKRTASGTNTEVAAPIAALPAAKFKLVSTNNAETYEVKRGARPFTDRNFTIQDLAPELDGLTGMRFSHEAAKSGRYEPIVFEVSEPVRVLIGFFNETREIWLPVPNPDLDAKADERGGVETWIENAAVIEQCPTVNLHAFRFEPGRHRLELPGKGSFVVLGVVPAAAPLQKRDAKLK